MKIIDSFNTTSDRGGVLIGNEDWQLLVPNGYGDGTYIYSYYAVQRLQRTI